MRVPALLLVSVMLKYAPVRDLFEAQAQDWFERNKQLEGQRPLLTSLQGALVWTLLTRIP